MQAWAGIAPRPVTIVRFEKARRHNRYDSRSDSHGFAFVVFPMLGSHRCVLDQVPGSIRCAMSVALAILTGSCAAPRDSSSHRTSKRIWIDSWTWPVPTKYFGIESSTPVGLITAPIQHPLPANPERTAPLQLPYSRCELNELSLELPRHRAGGGPIRIHVGRPNRCLLFEL